MKLIQNSCVRAWCWAAVTPNKLGGKPWHGFLSSLTCSLSSPSLYLSFLQQFYTRLSRWQTFLFFSYLPLLFHSHRLFSISEDFREPRATVYQEEDLFLYGNMRQSKLHCRFHPSRRIVCIMQFWILPMPTAQPQWFFLRLCTHRTFTWTTWTNSNNR